jgi:hypothetical protein
VAALTTVPHSCGHEASKWPKLYQLDPDLAQGQTQGSTLTTHQQALTTGPFGNTCGADAVSPEVAIGGCRTQVSTTRGNAKWIQNNNTQQLVIIYQLKPTSQVISQI